MLYPPLLCSTWSLPKRLDSLHGILLTVQRINYIESYKTELRICWKPPERRLVHEYNRYVPAMLRYKVGRERERTLIHEHNRIRESIHVHKNNDMVTHDICRYIRLYEYAAMRQLFVSVMKLRIFGDERSSAWNTQCADLHISTAMR